MNRNLRTTILYQMWDLLKTFPKNQNWTYDIILNSGLLSTLCLNLTGLLTFWFSQVKIIWYYIFVNTRFGFYIWHLLTNGLSDTWYKKVSLIQNHYHFDFQTIWTLGKMKLQTFLLLIIADLMVASKTSPCDFLGKILIISSW